MDDGNPSASLSESTASGRYTHIDEQLLDAFAFANFELMHSQASNSSGNCQL